MLSTALRTAAMPSSPAWRAPSTCPAISVLRWAVAWAPAATSSTEALISSAAAARLSIWPLMPAAPDRDCSAPALVSSARALNSSARSPRESASRAIRPMDARSRSAISARAAPTRPTSSRPSASKRTVRSPSAKRPTPSARI